MVWVIVCGVSPEGREESMVGRTCETGVFKPRLKERLMDNNSSELTEEDDMTRTGKVSQRQRDWDEVDREQGVDSRDKVKHIKRNDQLFIMRMMTLAKREMKSECCEEVKQRRGYADMKVGLL